VRESEFVGKAFRVVRMRKTRRSLAAQTILNFGSNVVEWWGSLKKRLPDAGFDRGWKE